MKKPKKNNLANGATKNEALISTTTTTITFDEASNISFSEPGFFTHVTVGDDFYTVSIPTIQDYSDDEIRNEYFRRFTKLGKALDEV